MINKINMKLFPITYTKEIIAERNKLSPEKQAQFVQENILPELYCNNCSKRIESIHIIKIESPNRNKKFLLKTFM